MAGQYQNTTLSTLLSQLALRLGDANNNYWSTAELTNCIVESLRIFQALTGFYREREILKTVVNQIFYDLRSALLTPPTGAYPYTFSVTDNQLLTEIQSHLIEPVTNPWTGTLQFSIPVIAQALQRNRDQFLSDTGSYVTRLTQAGPSPQANIVQLPQTVLDVRRCAWQDSATLLTFGLARSDNYAAMAYASNWVQNPKLPYSYSISVAPPLSLELIPAPANSGTVDLCLLSSGPNLACAAASPVAIGLMDDYCWGIKYGALADLLSEDGPAYDPDRAKYCRQLYSLAMSLARSPVSTLEALIDNIPTFIGSIEHYDRYKTGWQNSAAALPTDILQVAPNLIAVSPKPDKIYNIPIDMARSMIVPTVAGDFIQVSQEFLEPILDMAQHTASLKMAGTEFAATIPLRDNFLRMSALQNSRLRANIFFNQLLSQPATKNDLAVPRLVELRS